uniref:Zinc finger protein 865 n=1 Tax=Oncorhynchus kisutch TaxID=8019 RepID=A0A8C7H8J6_ONCKI
MEARELLENRTKEIDVLVAADEVRRYIITEPDYGMDMESAVGENDNQAVTGLNLLRPSQLKRSKRLQIKKMFSKRRKPRKTDSSGRSVDQQEVEVNTESCISPLTTKENDTEPLITAATSVPTLKEPKPCTVCGKIFNRASVMAIHMRSHSDERPYQCGNCEQRFKYMHNLNQHQRYICKVNREESSQMVDQHQEEESSELVAVNADTPETSTSRLQLVHWCKKCGKCFDDICNLKQHQESSCKEGKIKVVFQCEKRKVVFKCDDCGKDFKGSSSLRTHKRIHNPFYCSDCGRVLPNSIAFDRHKLMQHKEIQCTMCEKTFTLLGRLRDHYLHQHKFTGPYPCSQCEKTFTQLRYLVEHERVHSGEYPYQCSVCQAKFNKANSLTIHSRKHTGEKPFLCWQCGKSYKDRGNLSMHMGTHSEERPFSCSQCDMTYRTKIQLNTHIEQVHEGVRYTCAVCGKQFLKAVSLIRHELTHTGERPWPCSYCTKTFITANERRLHERYHTGERPYKCQDCGKSFVQLCFLKAHQRLHTGEKPFACSVCDKRFRLNYHRQRHEQTHTGKQKPHVCAECGLAFAQRKRLTEHQSFLLCQDNLSPLQVGHIKKLIKQHDHYTGAPCAGDNKRPLQNVQFCHTAQCHRCLKLRGSVLVRHMSSHSKERPFRCVNCGKRFKYSYDFRKHQGELCQKVTQGDLCQDVDQNMAQQKSGLQPEKVFLATAENRTQVDSKTCCVCGKILTCTSQMERHLKSHSKARPFHCAICERSFKYKDSLKKHQEILGHEGILEDFDLSVDHQQVEVNTESCSSPLTTKENDTELLIKAFTPAPTAKEHACTVCGKILDCASHLATHMRSHSEERPYQCVNCEQRFKYKQSLNQHQRYICKVNREESSQMVDQHQEEESSELVAVKADTPETSTSRLQLVHWCKKCGKCFDDICNLKQHQESSCKEGKIKVVFQCEKIKVVFKCDDCGKDFKGSSSLRTHKRIHNPFYCSDCGRVLPNSIALDRHKLMQHKEFQCTMCEKTFTLLGRLREHYLHQHKFTGPYPCSQCEKTFTQLSYLVIHERVHSGEYLYQCPVCQAKFNSANSLTIHSRKHTGEKPFLCWQCGKSFKAAGELSVHMGTHSEERPFSCSQCDMSYRTKLQMNSHIEQVHEGVRYPCTICGKQFYKAVSLKRHELTHTGERPFPCSYCTKTFITANEKRLHERYHTGERPYKCQDCGKSFIQSGYLKSHRRLHTGEKPFACSFCDKSFRLSYHRLKHERTHTRKNKPHVCGECGDICLKVNQEEASKLVDQQQEDATPEEAGELLATDDTRAECKEEERKVVFKCDECDKEFKGSSSLRTHKRIHNPFYCSDCGRIYPNSIAFDRHKLMHKEIQCTMCEKTFTLLGRLREHYLHQHKFTGPYPCSQCEKTFTQLSYLVIHERVHSGEYLYQCSVCPEKFRTLFSGHSKNDVYGSSLGSGWTTQGLSETYPEATPALSWLCA